MAHDTNTDETFLCTAAQLDREPVQQSDGRVIVWYPRGERHVVTFTTPPCCPTCGQPAPVGYPERDMVTTVEELFF